MLYTTPMDKVLNKKTFSVVARAKSFTHALRGLGIMIRTQQNAWVHVVAAIVAITLGFYFNISILEWVAIIFAIGLVMVSETFNTAMEIDIDLTSPTYHPYARDTKDVAAGAVLISVIIAVVIAILIFVPKIYVALL